MIQACFQRSDKVSGKVSNTVSVAVSVAGDFEEVSHGCHAA